MIKLRITCLPTTWKLISGIVLEEMCKAQMGIGKKMKANKQYMLSTNPRPQKQIDHHQNIIGQQESRLDAGTTRGWK